MLFTILILTAAVVANQAATTKSTPLCGRCLPRTVTLVPANGTGTITPVLRVLTNDSRGCRRMYVICNTPAGYTKSNMVMNEETNYPIIGKNVRALVTCFKASWHAELGGSYM
ncbi:unnamed protein product [Cylicocyclus nassatus]|uniref:Uncharacterized protein n=1 Tax=Cylicocyclus nassatus TaxID=53992 RepID=A0AA36H4R4_CYLNA|nr:unnamed protein product [Cylicocyclus nassatus]